MVENGVRKKRPRTVITHGGAHDVKCSFKFAQSRHAIWFTYIFSVWMAQQEARVKEFAVARFRKRPKIDPSGRLRMAMSEGPSLRTFLLWKVGLHVQSEDKLVFVCAESSLLASISSWSFLAPKSARSTPNRHSWVLNDRWRWPSSLRREANEARQWELARGLKYNLANVAMSQYVDAWY